MKSKFFLFMRNDDAQQSTGGSISPEPQSDSAENAENMESEKKDEPADAPQSDAGENQESKDETAAEPAAETEEPAAETAQV